MSTGIENKQNNSRGGRVLCRQFSTGIYPGVNTSNGCFENTFKQICGDSYTLVLSLARST